jgi:hypothetical protein
MTADVSERRCGSCTLCCKVMYVPQIDKKRDSWCRHCTTGKGCGIYEERPSACREFHCYWLMNDKLGPEWKPSEAKFVIAAELGGSRISIYVDAQRPDAWRREPFLKTFHAWSEMGARSNGQVVVYVAGRALVVVPDRIVDLGEVGFDDLILTRMVPTPQGMRLEPFRASKDDPRAKAFLASASGHDKSAMRP